VIWRLSWSWRFALLLCVAPLQVAHARLDSRSSALQQQGDVWVNRSSGVYHCPGSRYFGATRRGEYMSESSARGAGYRPAYGRSCGYVGSDRALGFSRRRAAPDTQLALSATVWVNLGSHVYHCAGTRYFGATKRGAMMRESEAQARGNRPAYGRQCS
jgi:hypothetical protein